MLTDYNMFVLLIATSSYEILVAIIQDKPVIFNIKRCLKMSKRLMATVIVKNVEIKGLSVNCNPSYWIEFAPKYSHSVIGFIKGYTASDASCGYSATNFKGKECKIEYHFTRTGSLIIDTMEEV